MPYLKNGMYYCNYCDRHAPNREAIKDHEEKHHDPHVILAFSKSTKPMNLPEQLYRGFLKILSNPHQRQYYQWIIDNGKSFEGRPLSQEEETFLSAILSQPLFTPKLCYLQSQIACSKTLRYYEGQATTKTLEIPIEHAWLVNTLGEVVDTTWNDGDQYFGVEIPFKFVKKCILKTGTANPLIGRYYQHQKETEK